jgi:hypothetical protein
MTEEHTHCYQCWAVINKFQDDAETITDVSTIGILHPIQAPDGQVGFTIVQVPLCESCSEKVQKPVSRLVVPGKGANELRPM